MSVPIYWQPRDRSLQAFKEWLGGNYSMTPPNQRSTATQPWIHDQEWILYWKKYWAKMDGSTKTKGSRA